MGKIVNYYFYKTCHHSCITDSGGIQEKDLIPRCPVSDCVKNTERSVTAEIENKVYQIQILDGRAEKIAIPALWGRKASERVADVIASRLNKWI